MLKQKSVICSVIFSAMFFLSGCAPLLSGAMNAGVDEKAVVEKTAKYFGTSTNNLQVSNIDKGALTTSYQVRYSGNLYNCTIYYGDVNCQQPGGKGSPDQSSASKGKDASMTPAQAQSRLNALGYPVGTPDGVLGSKSVAQLKQFQKSRGLPATGKLDEATVAELR